MTAIFSDTFAGGSGTLNGHVPETAFGALVWTSADMVLNGAGYAGPSNNVNRSVYGEAVYGNTSSARGLPNTFNLSFTLKTGPVVSGTFENTGFQIDIYANGATYSFILGGGESGWISFIAGLATSGQYAPAIAPSTEYPCTAAISPSGASFTVAGNTSTITAAAPAPATGLSGAHLFVGGTCLVGNLIIETSPNPTGIGSAVGPLGSAAVLGNVPDPMAAPQGRAATAGPLGSATAMALHDFTGQLGDVTSVYVADLITPGGVVRLPMSSWQATLQTDDASYVQCVIPACAPWVNYINAATEFVVYRRAVLPGGGAVEQEMARSPANTVQFDRGPQRYTCTISGYGAAFLANVNPIAAYDRVLTGVRSISSGNRLRVRCEVDWLLRPGQRVSVDSVSFVVGYINYYAPTGFDAYMDVGEKG